MKIYPSKTKTLLWFFGVSLLILLLFYFTFDGRFKWPLLPQAYIAIAGWAIITAIYFFITLKLSYYTLEKKYLSQKKLTKEYIYEYNRIIYIDEAWSRKNKILLFVTDRGDAIYLVLDKKQVLLDEMLKRCKKLKDRESVLIQFPKVKI
ncbi:MAG: hypothetical protein J1F31_04015 [Erysipelotrichales bacterium]|nr:hypothetical protein [Erysipelotrichales bacterium]